MRLAPCSAFRRRIRWPSDDARGRGGLFATSSGLPAIAVSQVPRNGVLPAHPRSGLLLSRDDPATARRRLVQRLRQALVPVLSEGPWKQIEDDHRKVELPWRTDFQPGWGKPKYVERVLDALPDDDAIGVARRALDRLVGRFLLEVEDALLWIDAGGVAGVSEVTRIALANILDGRRLHPSASPSDVLARFARVHAGAPRFEYAENSALVEFDADFFALFGTDPSKGPAVAKSNHLKLLDAHEFRDWPDARVFQLLEFVVHPTVRRGDEQASLVQAINAVLAADRFELFAIELLSSHPVFKVRPVNSGVSGRPKNLIFASTGPKPEIGFADAVNNDIVILRNADHCLVYDEPIGESGLSWLGLVKWWAAREGLDPKDASTRNLLGDRLAKSLASEPERRFFKAYFKILRPLLGDALPALVPQVYLHYDPMTLKELRQRGDARRFDVQRMDFLLLLSHGARIVIEVDGQQHYSTGTEASAKPSPEEYARTARSDRHLRLAGYEVYRFGGYELRDETTCVSVLEDFFTRLFRRHGN
jgi:very-short-patch-repair endonuclease